MMGASNVPFGDLSNASPSFDRMLCFCCAKVNEAGCVEEEEKATEADSLDMPTIIAAVTVTANP